MEQKQIKPQQPTIPETTYLEMCKFFSKTSIPRILAEKKKFEKDIKI